MKDLVTRLIALPPSAEIKVCVVSEQYIKLLTVLEQGEEHAIMGKLTLHSVYEQFRSDMFLSSLTESSTYNLLAISPLC